MKNKWIKLILVGCFSLMPMLTQASSIASMPESQGHLEENLAHVNDQIESLTKLRNYYIAKSSRYKEQAIRVKYQSTKDSEYEAERLNREAEDYDKRVKKLNQEIAKLEREKRLIEKKLDRD